ncbi:pirin family protein [uncultured Jatrophihabitans sp.]|uniref:pirin family protein n=1 Tax=uncultured Jatrophihabitans sp. TaxID=1610747 RepID=UPI0035C96AB4
MRYESAQPGIRSRHEFSAGAHYDPDNVSFGPIIGLDEHVLRPGAGFDWHGHRGVHIVSLVLDGTLRHADAAAGERLVQPGTLLVQSAADGFRHTEANASNTEPLRFAQLTVLDDAIAESSLRVAPAPVEVGGVQVRVERGDVIVDGDNPTVVLVLRGRYVEGVDRYGPGDCLRRDFGWPAFTAGDGELLLLELPSPPGPTVEG